MREHALELGCIAPEACVCAITFAPHKGKSIATNEGARCSRAISLISKAETLKSWEGKFDDEKNRVKIYNVDLIQAR